VDYCTVPARYTITMTHISIATLGVVLVTVLSVEGYYRPPPNPLELQLYTIFQQIQGVKYKLKDLKAQTAPLRPIELDNGNIMLFRVQPGILKESYTRYTNVGQSDDANAAVFDAVPSGCKGTDGREFCDRHYRSQVLDMWDTFIPVMESLRVGVYKDNVEMAYFEYSVPVGSTYLDWYRNANIIDSSYTDIDATSPGGRTTASANCLDNDPPGFGMGCNGREWSIEGSLSTTAFPDIGLEGHQRRFFINLEYGGCNSDKGWLVVEDEIGNCLWEANMQNDVYPNVFFANATTQIQWPDMDPIEFGKADTLVLSYKPKPLPEGSEDDDSGLSHY